MALQTSGAISLYNVRYEFTGNSTAAATAMRTHAVAAGLPTSGALSLAHYYGTQLQAPPGSLSFTSSGTFTVPAGYNTVSVCIIGGGGSGASDSNNSTVGGGYSGQIRLYTYTLSTTEKANGVAVVCGNGGLRVQTRSSGNTGQQSSFGWLVASGGAGGSIYDNYSGVGALQPTNCAGQFRDGNSYSRDGNTMYGGQAGFAAGGDADIYSGNAGSAGSGGGAGYGDTAYSGAGGKGKVIVSWG